MSDIDELARAASSSYRPTMLQRLDLPRVEPGDAFRFGLWAGLGFAVAQFIFLCLTFFVLHLLGWLSMPRPFAP